MMSFKTAHAQVPWKVFDILRGVSAAGEELSLKATGARGGG